MEQQSNRQSIEEDEISLIDIVKTIILRKKVFLSIFLSVLAVALSYGIFKKINSLPGVEFTTNFPVKYVTHIAIGYREAKYLLEPLETVDIAIKEVYQLNTGIPRSVETEFNLLKMGNVFKITSTEDVKGGFGKEQIEQHHKSIVEQLMKRHDMLYQQLLPKDQSKLTSQLFALPTTIVSVAKKISPYEDQSLQFTNKKFILILALGFFLALIMGIIGVFVYEFILNLRKELNESE